MGNRWYIDRRIYLLPMKYTRKPPTVFPSRSFGWPHALLPDCIQSRLLAGKRGDTQASPGLSSHVARPKSPRLGLLEHIVGNRCQETSGQLPEDALEGQHCEHGHFWGSIFLYVCREKLQEVKNIFRRLMRHYISGRSLYTGKRKVSMLLTQEAPCKIQLISTAARVASGSWDMCLENAALPDAVAVPWGRGTGT